MESSPIPDPVSRRMLARSQRKEEILDYSLVLASQGLKHWVEFDGREFGLSLEEQDFAAAETLLETYRQENRNFHEDRDIQANLDLFIAPLFFLIVPVFFYFWVGMKPWANWWISRGSADARLILQGEWWRCVTATTLHAGPEHFLSNLLSGYFILNLVNHRLGMGTAMLTAVLGAAAANYVVALASTPEHISIGFSTVVFCALGMLAAQETLHHPRPGEKTLRRLTPLISALFIAILVGLGERADVKAHFYGFAAGGLLGFLIRRLPRSLARPPWQAGMILSTYGLYAAAWWLAARE